MARHALAIVMIAASVVFGVGCAKDATGVSVTVDADTAVPPILILRTALAPAGDPSRQVATNRTSPYASDAADRPGPFVFPLQLSLTVDDSLAGSVVVTIEGIDWDSGAVTARGSGPAMVVAQRTTSAAITMTAVAPP